MAQIWRVSFDEQWRNQVKSSTCVIATIVASSSDVSFPERLFIQYATLTARRSGYDVTKSIINATIIEANEGDEN